MSRGLGSWPLEHLSTHSHRTGASEWQTRINCWSNISNFFLNRSWDRTLRWLPQTTDFHIVHEWREHPNRHSAGHRLEPGWRKWFSESCPFQKYEMKYSTRRSLHSLSIIELWQTLSCQETCSSASKLKDNVKFVSFNKYWKNYVMITNMKRYIWVRKWILRN